LHDYTDDHETAIKSIKSRYIGYGYEVGSATERPHLQGFIVFDNAVHFSALKKKFVSLGLRKLNFRACRGSDESNLSYCSKDGNYFEQGDRPLSQKEKGEAGRLRYLSILERAEKGDLASIREEYPKLYLHQIKILQYHHTLRCPKPSPLTVLDNRWIWGDTGTGKSLSLDLDYPNAYHKDPHNKWWDGYNGEEVVILDDLDQKKAQDFVGGYLKRWCDYRPFLAESKGGNTRYIRPKSIHVTSNYSISDIWYEPALRDPIARRFQEVKQAKGLVPALLARLNKTE